MSDWYPVLKLADLPAGQAATAEGPGGQELALYNVDGTIYCSENGCLHQGGPLGEGFLEGKCVSCPWHGWEFDVTTGECLEMPGEQLKTFPTRIEGDTIQVQM